MILKAVTCPDCGEFSVQNIQINEFGAPVWVCQKCGVVHEDGSWYRCNATKSRETDNGRKSVPQVAARSFLDCFEEGKRVK